MNKRITLVSKEKQQGVRANFRGNNRKSLQPLNMQEILEGTGEVYGSNTVPLEQKPTIHKKKKVTQVLTDTQKRTKRFQEILVKSFGHVLEDRLKKDLPSRVAYKVFKESFDTMVEFLKDQKKYTLDIPGVGIFKIAMSKPRIPLNGFESPLLQYGKVPRLQWEPSKRYDQYLFTKMLDNKG